MQLQVRMLSVLTWVASTTGAAGNRRVSFPSAWFTIGLQETQTSVMHTQPYETGKKGNGAFRPKDRDVMNTTSFHNNYLSIYTTCINPQPNITSSVQALARCRYERRRTKALWVWCKPATTTSGSCQIEFCGRNTCGGSAPGSMG